MKNLKKIFTAFICAFFIILPFVVLQSCGETREESNTSDESKDESKTAYKSIDTKKLKAIIGDYETFESLNATKKDFYYLKENIDQSRWVDLNGKKLEVYYGQSSQNGNIPYDQYIYDNNNGYRLSVYYIPDTTYIYHISTVSEFFEPRDIIISESEKKQIADTYISQYIDISKYTLFVTDVNGEKSFCYNKTINGIETGDYYYVTIDKYGIMTSFFYNPEFIGDYDDMDLGDLNPELLSEIVKTSLNEMSDKSGSDIENLTITRNILLISDDGRRYITCQVDYIYYELSSYTPSRFFTVIILD